MICEHHFWRKTSWIPLKRDSFASSTALEHFKTNSSLQPLSSNKPKITTKTRMQAVVWSRCYPDWAISRYESTNYRILSFWFESNVYPSLYIESQSLDVNQNIILCLSIWWSFSFEPFCLQIKTFTRSSKVFDSRLGGTKWCWWTLACWWC